ncbi:hypothetical protein BC937DRAFT_91948 [Endogone sp. FLAS-F59071]|nr:hypothetical protein BC937DRAFT_91948 [Endogone sp. FLAS-F59071]|eukprot:RUS15827.1 hypothetical protein BC937DRAFT_91948 [Endogone sp. FLAS-F59071]
MNDNLDSNATKRKRTTKVIVDSPNNLDLDTYIANYKGHTKVDRLLFIAERCPPLQIEAYRLAVAELKATSLDTAKYSHAVGKLNDALVARSQPAQPLDSAWVETTQKKARAQTEKLEAELKSYKNNMIKESIRMGHNDLGDHYYNCGDLPNALKCYSRTRDYCTTAKHIVDMCLNVIKVSIETSNFAHVQSYVAKAEGAPEVQDKSLVQAKLRCASALAMLDTNNQNKYKQAARMLLETSFEIGSNYNEVISPNDVAIYGGLCALASFDRAELKKQVIDNAEFKNFLELEPHIRELIHSFYHSNYKTCLEILDKSKVRVRVFRAPCHIRPLHSTLLFFRTQNDLLLDLHLHAHVETLYENIRKKALVQYFSPFLSVDLNRMAASFSTDVRRLESELAQLITDNQIQARIDSHNKILCAKQQDQRSHVFEKSLAVGADYDKATRALLLRFNMIKAELVVRPPKEL